MIENKRHNAKNVKLKFKIKELEKNNTKKNIKFKDRVTKVK